MRRAPRLKLPYRLAPIVVITLQERPKKRKRRQKPIRTAQARYTAKNIVNDEADTSVLRSE
jgi:hypothetical protein